MAKMRPRPGKAGATVAVKMDADALARLDAIARRIGMSRSAAVRTAVQMFECLADAGDKGERGGTNP